METVGATAVQGDEPPRAAEAAPAAAGDMRAIALLGGAQALVLVGGMVRWKIAALYLGPSGVGIAGVIDQIALVVLQIGTLNIPTVALRFLAVARSGGLAEFGRLYRAFLTVVLSGCAVAAVAAALLFLIRPGILSSELVPYRAVFFVALATVPFTGAFTLLRNAMSTLDRHRTVAYAMVAGTLLTLVASLIGIRVAGLEGLYVAAFIATLTMATALHAGIVRHARIDATGQRGALAAFLEHPSAMRYAAALYTVGFTVPLGYGMVRSSVLSTLGAEAAGYIAASYTIATGARQSFTQASLQFLTPRASRQAPKDVRAREVGAFLHTLPIAMGVSALPVVLFPHEVLTVLFSSRFTVAVSFLGLFLLAELMMAFGDAYRTLLLGFDDLPGYVATTLAAPCIVMAGVLFVVPRYGIVGAGWLQIGAAVTALGVSVGRLWTRHDTPPDRRALVLFGIMLAMIGGGTVLGQLGPANSMSIRLMKLAAGVILGAGGIWLLPPGERASLLRFVTLKGHFARSRGGRSAGHT